MGEGAGGSGFLGGRERTRVVERTFARRGRSAVLDWRIWSVEARSAVLERREVRLADSGAGEDIFVKPFFFGCRFAMVFFGGGGFMMCFWEEWRGWELFRSHRGGAYEVGKAEGLS